MSRFVLTRQIPGFVMEPAKGTRRCSRCRRTFPAGLVHEMFRFPGRSARLCGVCALKERNAMHGLPPSTPFAGGQAQAVYEQTVAYLKAHPRKETP